MYSQQTVIIKIESEIKQEGQLDKIDLQIEGLWDFKNKILTYNQNDKINLIYFNQERIKMVSVPKTSLENKHITVQLESNNQTILEFEEDKTLDSIYATQFGKIKIFVYSSKVKSKISENSGYMNLEYQLKQENNNLGEFKLILDFQTSNNKIN
ncbi:MAG: DUF1934 domain-containing protein [Lactobacillaceae bacterium]|jgi:uncharacterized beta-barrel protein YwiB (DUF1934 family)|nr:DUF1934 domain-containing protein [Lactobacillaceae bacterium]